MTSENRRYPPDAPFAYASTGAALRFLCPGCGKSSEHKGSGVRRVLLMRSMVCKHCKEVLDRKKV